MKLFSEAFDAHGEVLPQYAAATGNRIPPVHIKDPPPGTESLLIEIQDVDSAIGPLTHWLVWNLPPDLEYIDGDTVPEEASVGLNSFGVVGYTGPAPPAGIHNILFRVCALNRRLEAESGASREQVDREIEGCILSEAKRTVHLDHNELHGTD